ncbi:MAG TPA: metal-dependent transcriptional regulator [Thermoleophilia bacterium]|nr:metal-dependent transcriptional regulator [Thermoleophilia bacterium]
MPTQAVEEYLESIYKLNLRGGRVIAARLAEDLSVSAPTATEMLRRLRDAGYVRMGAEKEITLTDAGVAAAEVLVRRHRLSERLLTDILGMPWSRAHEEACKFEHVISPEVEARLARVLDNPSTCPHGNPIPGTGGGGEELVRLSQAPVGSRGQLRCVEAEDEELLSYVERLGLVPGAIVEVLGFSPLEGPVEVRVSDERVSVGLAAAERLLMRLISTA